MGIVLLAALIIAAPAAALAFLIPGMLIKAPEPFAPLSAGNGHFSVITSLEEAYRTALESEAQRFASGLEKFFRSTLSSSGVPIAVELPERRYDIHYVRDMAELNDFYGATHFGELEYNDGYFDPSRKIIVLRHASKERFPRDAAALRHELTHLVMNEAFPNGPAAAWSPWFAEGLAYYFESEDDLKAALTKATRASSTRFIPLADLLDAENGRFVGSDNKYYYDESLTLTAFLINKYPAQFSKYFHLEAEPGPVRTLDFEAVFGKSLEEIEREWKSWLWERG
jgi:hypothetical protein